MLIFVDALINKQIQGVNMATIELNQENFEQLVNGKDMVIVDFWAPWCGPCVSFAPTYEKISDKYPDVVFGKVNTEVEQELAGYFQIRSIPTLMVFRENVIVYSEAGALPASGLEQLIAQVQKLDMKVVHEQIAAQETN
jgi:thioredoxin